MDVTGSLAAEAEGWALLVHGGAGSVPEPSRGAHAQGCRVAAEAGAVVLVRGGSALDAVQRAVQVLEDDPRFNAGTGACLTEDETIELDASLIDGETLRAGAVCALPPFANPILVARAVLDDGRHVLYAGDGAARFARAHGFVPATLAAMTTEAARRHLEAARKNRAADGFAGGTVGAVARDARGHVAAATSTGGTTNKSAGRVGDSPILGAGNYADDGAGACSVTGQGEFVLRTCLAKTAIDWMRDGAHPEDAARTAIRMLARRTGGTGGLILMGPRRHLGWARSTETMGWAAAAQGWPEPKCGC